MNKKGKAPVKKTKKISKKFNEAVIPVIIYRIRIMLKKWQRFSWK